MPERYSATLRRMRTIRGARNWAGARSRKTIFRLHPEIRSDHPACICLGQRPTPQTECESRSTVGLCGTHRSAGVGPVDGAGFEFLLASAPANSSLATI